MNILAIDPGQSCGYAYLRKANSTATVSVVEHGTFVLSDDWTLKLRQLAAEIKDVPGPGRAGHRADHGQPQMAGWPGHDLDAERTNPGTRDRNHRLQGHGAYRWPVEKRVRDTGGREGIPAGRADAVAGMPAKQD